MRKLTFIDLFAGAGGLSEGFIRAGFDPVAHVEFDLAACNTLKTRMVRHWLFEQNRYDVYESYLQGKISRTQLWSLAPDHVLNSVINQSIGKDTNPAIFESIDNLLKKRKVDLVIGGPPCQAYSLAGRSRDINSMVGDDRNYLYKYYAEFLDRYKPMYFIFENVLGLLSAKDETDKLYFDKIRTLFKKIGYETEYQVLNASDYGIPQQRKRIILIGKHGKKTIYPEPEKESIPIDIAELFADLPKIKAGGGTHAPQKYTKDSHLWLYQTNLRNNSSFVTWHLARPNNAQDLKIYQIVVKKWNKERIRFNYNDLPEPLKTHNNRDAHTDRFKVVAGNLTACHTVVAHIAKDGHYYIHPDISQNRSITPREAARLQTFPDDYYFEGTSEKPSRTAAFKQIGNAVPVLLGEKIAQKLKEVW